VRVAVVGGGITGLAAAYRCARSGASVSLYEASSRLGGVVHTKRRDGYLMEAGPDSFLDKAGIASLCQELGIAGQLIRVQPDARRSFIVRDGRLHPVPEGLYLMAPSAIRPFIFSQVVSWPAKARMLLDLALPGRHSGADESLASFVGRRLGREALDRLAQPLLSGIYGADPSRLSLAATMPQFLDMERLHGSVIRALLRSRQQRASGARYGLFLSLRDGLQSLVDALASHVSDVRLNARVTDLGQLDAGALCLCVPAPELARLLADLPLPVATYSSAATINLGFRRAQIRHGLDGAGFVVPQVEHRAIVACTFSSQKFEGRAPSGRVLLRAFAGGMLSSDVYARSDEELISSALGDLRELIGIDGEPDAVWLSRLPETMPQYEVGHLDRLAQLEAALASKPKLALAGNGYRGVGVPDCIAGGFAAADRLLAALD